MSLWFSWIVTDLPSRCPFVLSVMHWAVEATVIPVPTDLYHGCLAYGERCERREDQRVDGRYCYKIVVTGHFFGAGLATHAVATWDSFNIW